MKESFIKTINVRVILKSGEKFSIQYNKCDNKAFKVSITDQNIKITQINNNPQSFYFNLLGIPQITVTLPKNTDLIDVKAQYKEVILKDLKCNSLYVNMHNGKVQAQNIKAENILLQTTNGVALARNISVSNLCHLNTKNGISVLETFLRSKDGYEVNCINGKIYAHGHYRDSIYSKNGVPTYIVHCEKGKAILKETR
ncbi:DUF4097 family beta strand repeat protein [Actinomyces sp. zg-332]|uniref:DUF4097 family beta strand repeat-containing protein n=1 Tax=Actinomyces sp. zg-332 TaxID=2708340 RepID=UPI001423D48E|nr:DUF4097 family beta strand repeat-containing protein [Actinomyces sp. zg-332]QPK93809.1 DUF4097 family beta strand repeat protein [Actinomyces sp. zg-332]